MSHVSLFRQYRPQRFDQVYGQEHITRTLQNALAAGRVGQAYLFTGPRGVGKTTVARLLAKALNCEQGMTAGPCDECESCRRIAAGSSMAVREIDAASHRSIDDIRLLREDVQFVPSDGRMKVYILDEAHQITSHGFEAFLKTLEEPPAHAMFIMATTEAHKLPLTILSRCQRLDFRRVGVPTIVARLEEVVTEEGFDADAAALRVVARAADGSLRDALSLLDQIVAYAGERITVEHVEQVLGTLDADTRLALGQALLDSDAAAVLEWLNELLDAGRDPQLIVDQAQQHCRLLLLARLNAAPEALEALPPDVRARVEAQAEAFAPERLMAITEGLASADRDLRWHSQPRILLEVTLLELALELPRASVPLTPAAAAAAPAATERPRPRSDEVVPPPPRRIVRDPERVAAPPAPEPTAPPEREPAAARTSAVEPLAADEALTLEAVSARWPALMAELETQYAVYAAHYHNSPPTRIEGQTIVVNFGDREGAVELCLRGRPTRRVNELFTALLGRPVEVRPEVGDLPAAPAPPQPSELERATRLALEVFPGASVERRPSKQGDEDAR